MSGEAWHWHVPSLLLLSKWQVVKQIKDVKDWFFFYASFEARLAIVPASLLKSECTNMRTGLFFKPQSCRLLDHFIRRTEMTSGLSLSRLRCKRQTMPFFLKTRHHRASFASKCIKMRTANNTILSPLFVAAACYRFPSFFWSQWTSG